MKYVKTIDQKVQFDVGGGYWFEQDSSHYYLDGEYTYCLFCLDEKSFYYKYNSKESNIESVFIGILTLNNTATIDFKYKNKQFKFDKSIVIDGYIYYNPVISGTINDYIDESSGRYIAPFW